MSHCHLSPHLASRAVWGSGASLIGVLEHGAYSHDCGFEEYFVEYYVLFVKFIEE